MKAKTAPKSKYLYLLPNLFTFGSLFAGFYAIVMLTGMNASNKSSVVFAASIALLLAAVCDLLDGRVARMTGTQSEFGFQMDSLADLVSFGVAPSVLVYKWALEPFGMVGVFAAAAFASCGAARLARFNVMESKPKKKEGPSRFFQGLPIPVSAATLISIIMLHSQSVEVVTAESGIGMACLALVLSFLMVSNFRFRTFKDLRLNPQSISVLVILSSVIGVSMYLYGLSVALVLFFSTFVTYGLITEIFSVFTRVLQAARASK